MADKAKPASGDASESIVNCGVVMPISATANKSQAQWATVQTLIHRAIVDAGFCPKNVWAHGVSDRISTRIIGNLLQFEIVVVDISDHNPNVMIELGLRLTSKKPTVVIKDNTTKFPFDIHDFSALQYPYDLNIVEMENFFSEIAVELRDKHQAFTGGDYKPFLNEVITEVAEPKGKTLEPLDLVLSRLDDIERKVWQSQNPPPPPSQNRVVRTWFDRAHAFSNDEDNALILTRYFSVTPAKTERVSRLLQSSNSIKLINSYVTESRVYFKVAVLNSPASENELASIIVDVDASIKIPADIRKTLD